MLITINATVAALLVMMSIGASAASAGEFHAEGGSAELRAGKIGAETWSVNAGTVKCLAAAHFGGMSSATATTFKINSIYEECTAFGFVNAIVDNNGCTYGFSGDNGDFVISCAATEPLTITAFNCWVTIGSQTLSGVTFSNTGTGTSRDVDITVNVSGLKYTQHSKNFPGCSNGSFTNGTFIAQYTVSAFGTNGNQVGFWRQ